MSEAGDRSLTAEDVFRPPRDAADQPWERLAAWLEARGQHLDDTPPRQFAGGYGNLNYLVEIDGVATVLRRPPPGPLPPGGNDMAREHRVLARLWEAFPLAPRALALCEDAEVLGAPFLLIEYRPGLVVRGELPPALRAAGPGISRTLVDVLADLHAVDPAAVGLDTLGRPEGFLGRTVEGWYKRAGVATGGVPPAAVGEIADWLRDNLPDEGEVSLVHNDYKLDNVILDPSSPTEPIAVIDWDMCTRGDPLLDLATLLAYWPDAADPPVMHRLGQMPGPDSGMLTRAQALDRYASRTGRDLSDFVFHRVLGLFRLGVVFLQLHGRYRRGLVRDERFAGFRKLAEGILDFTIEVSEGRAT
ncbi:MAG: phosphotransferase family protein [Ectothiorhodospiraceae bacterium]|nr:phosphotransferase family protein [Chromatiales bacterium]MCP5153796.1 phosphotransferase family protein [Ectothiorhodospiraceae bacterium]